MDYSVYERKALLRCLISDLKTVLQFIEYDYQENSVLKQYKDISRYSNHNNEVNINKYIELVRNALYNICAEYYKDDESID